jgi:hypothetical protein
MLFAAQDGGDATKHEEAMWRRRFGGEASAKLSIFAMKKWREQMTNLVKRKNGGKMIGPSSARQYNIGVSFVTSKMNVIDAPLAIIIPLPIRYYQWD